MRGISLPSPTRIAPDSQAGASRRKLSGAWRAGNELSPRWLNWALLMACVVLPLLLSLFKVLSDRQAAMTEAYHDAENVSCVFEQHVSSTFQAYQLIAALLNEHVRDLSWDEIERSQALPSYLSQVVRRYPSIGGISMLDAGGRLRLTTLDGTDRDQLRAAEDDFTALLTGKADSLLVGPGVQQGPGDQLDVAIRRTTPDGAFDGLIVISARPSFFPGYWARIAPDDMTLMFRTDGKVLARSPPGQQAAAKLIVGKSLLAASRHADYGSLISRSSVDGTERLIDYRKVDGYGVFIAHAVPMSHVLRQWRGSALRDGWFFLLAGGALCLLAVAVTRHSRREAEAIELLLQRSNELTMEAERRAQAEADLGAVLRDTVEQQEAERKRLARELHDSLGQHVAVLHMGFEGILRRAANPEEVREQVGRLKTTATAVSVEIGRLAWELRPAGLDELGLEAALRSLVESTTRRSGLQIDLHIRPSNLRPSPAVEATLYRVVQEAVTNIIKHASASRADIVVEITPRRARVIIEDDGKGFVWDGSKMGRPGARLGLLGVRERLSLVGGSFEVESSPGRGATLFIDVPA